MSCMEQTKVNEQHRFKHLLRRLARFLLCAYLLMNVYEGITDAEPEIFMDTGDFVAKYGYPFETHDVTTEDGYILTVHRIPHGPKDNSSMARPVVFLQHGIMSASDSWVLRGPEADLAFMLVDAGFDVWLGNSRGNDYSHRHKFLSLNSEAYWQFSWHEMGFFDLPATIDYILIQTGHKRLSYVGFSMGTTMFFVMCSTRSEYNTKVEKMIGMGPTATLQGLNMFNVFGIEFLKSVHAVSTMLGRHQVLARTSLRAYFMNIFCGDRMFLTQYICIEIAKSIGGRSNEQTNSTLVPIVYSHVPAGISVYSLNHFVQNLHAKKFRQYDYGKELNIQLYNSTEPPEYQMEKITVPIELHFADNDDFSNQNSIEYLIKYLPNVVKTRRVPYTEFNHFDFMWGADANRLVYDDIVASVRSKQISSFQ